MERMIVNLKDVDITQSYNFEQYLDYKEQFNFEADNRPFITTYMPQEAKNEYNGLANATSQIPPHQLREKADALLNAQKIQDKRGDLIDHLISKGNGNYTHFNSLWSPIIWQAHEDNNKQQVKIGDKIVDIFNLDYAIAESLQHLYSSEEPEAEYYDWIQRQQKIEIDINTNGTTEDEIVARNSFISFLDDRETEIKRIVYLYAGAAFNPNCRMQNSAQEKIKFLTFKLSELRRLREKTSNTKAYADEKEYFELEERRRQREAIAATAGITAVVMLNDQHLLGNKRLAAQNDINSLEHGIGANFVQLRPETRTIEQAQNKIQSALNHREQLQEMFAAMRNGMSKEEWMRTRHNTPFISTKINADVQNIRGWQMDRFREISNETSA